MALPKFTEQGWSRIAQAMTQMDPANYDILFSNLQTIRGYLQNQPVAPSAAQAALDLFNDMTGSILLMPNDQDGNLAALSESVNLSIQYLNDYIAGGGQGGAGGAGGQGAEYYDPIKFTLDTIPNIEAYLDAYLSTQMPSEQGPAF